LSKAQDFYESIAISAEPTETFSSHSVTLEQPSSPCASVHLCTSLPRQHISHVSQHQPKGSQYLSDATVHGEVIKQSPVLALQVLITNALQAVLPPNSTVSSVTLMRQMSNDTVVVNTAFTLWESQLPTLLANKCCALEVLYLRYAVERVSPSAVGKPSDHHAHLMFTPPSPSVLCPWFVAFHRISVELCEVDCTWCRT